MDIDKENPNKIYSHIGNSGYFFELELKKDFDDCYAHGAGNHSLIISSYMGSHGFNGPKVELVIPTREVFDWMMSRFDELNVQKKLRWATDRDVVPEYSVEMFNLQSKKEAGLFSDLFYADAWIINEVNTFEGLAEEMTNRLEGKPRPFPFKKTKEQSFEDEECEDEESFEDEECEDEEEGLSQEEWEKERLTKFNPVNVHKVQQELLRKFEAKNPRLAELYRQVLDIKSKEAPIGS